MVRIAGVLALLGAMGGAGYMAWDGDRLGLGALALAQALFGVLVIRVAIGDSQK